ncbi:MAG: hypothetical protein LBT39_10750, partial [Treponema sp.]|nr:hypothetical protein [Treponema sp.]
MFSKNSITAFALFFVLVGALSPITAQSIRDANAAGLPLRKISLFSSGVGYFEHSSPITGSASLRFSFKAELVNDALKSLIINDPESVAPRVSYP